MKKVFRLIFRFLLVSFFLGLTTLLVTYLIVAKDLPDVEALRDVQLQVPLRVYTQDAKLISVFGEKRPTFRTPLSRAKTHDFTFIREWTTRV